MTQATSSQKYADPTTPNVEDGPDPSESMALKPSFVREMWQTTEKRRRQWHKSMRRNKRAYESQMWRTESNDDSITNSVDEGPVTVSGRQVVVEVPRMPTIIQTYTGYLFPRAPRTVFSPDVDGSGDPTLAQLAADRWFALQDLHTKLSQGIGQSLLYKGSALKLGLDLTKALPQDRVWAKIVPWWDLVMDWDVQDKDEARFFGHSYWEDRSVLEARFGPLPEEVKPRRKDIYLERTSKYGDTPRGEDPTHNGAEAERFIHVLEWYNLVDDFEMPDGTKIRGVFEVYFVEQLMKTGKPFLRKAIPYSYPNGEPCVPLFPLIFDSVKEAPLQGIALADRVYAQCYEMMLLRTAQANGLRRDARTAFADKESGINQDDLAKWVKGEDGAVIMIEKAPGKSWDDIFHFAQFPPMNQDHTSYAAAIEQDLSVGANAPRFTRGEAMGSRTTATEVQQLNTYMENRFGELARIKDSWIASIAKGYVRVLMAAMKATEILKAQEEGRDIDESKYGTVAYIVGPKKEARRITVENLDGAFEVGIVDAASTPMSRESHRQNIMLLAGPQANLLSLWQQAKGGDAMSVTLLNNIVDLYDLPADFGYKHLMELQSQLDAEQAAKKPPAPTEPGPQDLPPDRQARALANIQQIAGAPAPQEATPGVPQPAAPPPPGM